MKLKLVGLALLLAGLVGCKDADIQQMKSMGTRHKVTMYGCDGKVIQTWESTGNVSNANQSDGWYFKDAKTGLLVEVTGPVVIEQE